MAGLDSFTNITKISDSLYEVTGGDAVLDSTLDALIENVTIVQKDGGWLVYGGSLTSTFERCTIIETSTAKALGNTGYRQRFRYNTSPTFKGCHFILENGAGRGRMHFSAFDPCTPKFLKTDYGTPCRFSRIIPSGTSGNDLNGNMFHRYGTFDGFIVTSKSYVTGFNVYPDFELQSDNVTLLDITLTGNNSVFGVVPSVSNYSVYRGVGAYQIATFQYYLGGNLDIGEDEWGNITGSYGTNADNSSTIPIKTLILVDTKGWLRQNEWDYWRQKSNLMFKRTYRSTPVDPSTLAPINVKCYLKNIETDRIYVNGETNGVDEELLQYRYRAYLPKTGKQISNTDADGNLIATGDFLIFEDHYIRGFIAYDKLPDSRSFQVVNNENGDPTEENVLMVDDSFITDSRVNTDAYSEIDTPQKFYNKAKAFLVDNYEGETQTIVTRDGNTINARSYNVVVDDQASDVFAFNGTTITIKASRFVGNIQTTGTITLNNNAQVIGTYGANTVLPWEVTNVEATAQLQLYNVTKSLEVENLVVTGTAGTKVTSSGTYTGSEVSVGDNIRLRITCQAGTSAFLPYEAFGVATSVGISFEANQVADTIYNDNGINADNLTTLSADYPNVQIDISDGDGIADAREFYAFYVKQTTTSTGIEKWFGAITAIDHMNYRVNTSVADIKLQNTGNTPLVISGARIFRDNGTSILHADVGDQPMTQDNGELIQYIKGQVNESLETNLPPAVASAINSNTTINGIDKNAKLIPALL